MPSIISKNQTDTYNRGREYASKLQGGEILALSGPLGAGKTTFIKGAVNYFLPGKRVLSPTFIIVRHYYPQHSLIKHLLHVDLYRLQDTVQIQDLGLDEFFALPQTVVLIEWADRMGQLLPQRRIDVNFKIRSANTREILITSPIWKIMK